MSNEELRGKIWSLFNLEPDDDGIMPREFPAQRIVRHHNLDISYMKTSAPRLHMRLDIYVALSILRI